MSKLLMAAMCIYFICLLFASAITGVVCANLLFCIEPDILD